ncbi:ligand-dependent nuclear receptor-interacting factor 1 [Paroedura picta]|uniref:ligand-dependent nuclear receptor-interacting factor 1 n=1 Tax=Paroedura picta TaxID=143630 RepID=UPI004057C713
MRGRGGVQRLQIMALSRRDISPPMLVGERRQQIDALEQRAETKPFIYAGEGAGPWNLAASPEAERQEVPFYWHQGTLRSIRSRSFQKPVFLINKKTCPLITWLLSLLWSFDEKLYQKFSGSLGKHPLGHHTKSVAGNIYRLDQMAEPNGNKLVKLLPVSETLGNAGPSIYTPVVLDNTQINASVSGLLSLKTMFTKTSTVFSNTTTPPLVNIPAVLTGAPGKFILPKQMEKVTHVVNKNQMTTSSSAIQNNYVSADLLSLPNDAASVSSVQSNVLMNVQHLPVVNTPVLPSGHHLQIPAYAEVKSVPASCLPPAVQEKILAVAATNASLTSEAAKPPNVIYVSPVKTVKTPNSKCLQNINPTPAAEIAKPLILMTAPTAVSNPVPDVVSHDIQKPREAPMKWVVQENPQSSASCLVPVRSSNDMVSKMLKTLVDKKNVTSSPACTLPACSSSVSESQAKLSSIKDNALVMYNGKVYLLTRKESSTESALDDKHVPATADTHLRKHTSQVASSFGDNTITNQVVNLVLSKNKGVQLSAKDPKSCENVNPSLWSDQVKTLKVAPNLLTSPNENLQIGSVSPQEAVSLSENTPGGIKVDDKTVTDKDPNIDIQKTPKTVVLRSVTDKDPNIDRKQKKPPKTVVLQSVTDEDPNIDIIQKTPPKTVVLRSSICGVSKEEEQKIEKINSTEMPGQIIQRKVQHRKQYTEIRKKFDLLKEERVYLRRLPLLKTVIKTNETERASNTNDSCKLLQAISVRPDSEEEEMILGEQESNIKRKIELPGAMSENSKRRRTLGPNLDCNDSSSVTDNPGSSCEQVLSQQENPAVSLPLSSNGDSDPNACMQSNEDTEDLCPTLNNIRNETSFSAGSPGEDSFLFSPPDLEETIKDEKIERLKLLLKKQEAALEEMHKKLQEA